MALDESFASLAVTPTGEGAVDDIAPSMKSLSTCFLAAVVCVQNGGLTPPRHDCLSFSSRRLPSPPSFCAQAVTSMGRSSTVGP